jgi:hypothetical protein
VAVAVDEHQTRVAQKDRRVNGVLLRAARCFAQFYPNSAPLRPVDALRGHDR